jgi:hypothetical protein
MEKSDFTDREQEWIAKYRAALEALLRQQPSSQGLPAFLDSVRTQFKLAVHATLGRVKHSTKALKPRKNGTASAIRPPIGSGQTKQGVLGEQLASAELECRRAS